MRIYFRPRSEPNGTHGRRFGDQPVWVLTCLLTLTLLVSVEAPIGATQAITTGQTTQRTCDQQVLALPGLTPTSETSVAAMSDSGLVVGNSRETGAPSSVVVWTSADRIINTGVSGTVRDNVMTSFVAPVDVNEAGVVAINRVSYSSRASREEAILWSESGGVTVLPAPAFRPIASVSAINDNGDAVGMVRGRSHGSVAVVWRDGKRSRLPAPKRSWEADINNHGLVVGGFIKPDFTRHLWTWRAGTKVRLLIPPEKGHAADTSNVLKVDDSGRIMGNQRVKYGDKFRTILWRTRDASPRRLMSLVPRDLHNSGYLAVSSPAIRDRNSKPYVGHLRDGGVAAQLPAPPVVEGVPRWSRITAMAVARGPSPLAPQGGVTIAGLADNSLHETVRAFIWTCTQTLLR